MPGAENPDDDTRLTLSGTVRMPDGSPAREAIVESRDDRDAPPFIARADRFGRFQVRGVFGNTARLHARSADGALQATRMISSDAVRAASESELQMTLAPAVDHEILVLAEGHPVEGAEVVAWGDPFRVRSATGKDGRVVLRIPAGDRIGQVIAWHPQHGLRAWSDLEVGPPTTRTELILHAPAPFLVRVLDPDDRPIPNLELGVNVLAQSEDWSAWSMGVPVDAAHVRTGPDGLATVAWAPKLPLRFVNVHIVNRDWKLDRTDVDRLGERRVTVHARRRLPVRGRVVMPEGARADGLLVSGFGFGPNTGDTPCVRTAPDGSFTLRVPSEHAYTLGIIDREWGSEIWTGLILATDGAKPAEVVLNARRTTPVMIRVNRGPEPTPVAGAWVEVGRSAEVQFVDRHGKSCTGSAGIRYWVRTDNQGIALAGMLPGVGQLRLSSTTWEVKCKVTVWPDRPHEVEFHRAWPARNLVGRLISDNKRYTPSPDLEARAWTSPGDGRPPSRCKVAVKPDGTFEITFDAEAVTLVFHDPDRRLSGFAKVPVETASVEVTMVGAAVYRGTVLDENGQPLAEHRVNLWVQNGSGEPVVSARTDTAGRFDFPAVPGDVPLLLSFQAKEGRENYALTDENALREFAPGEVREGDILKPRRLPAR
jgi:hypothetical protein